MIHLRRIQEGLLLLVIFIGIGIHPQPPSVRLVFLGDVMLGRGVARAHAVVEPKSNNDQGFLPGRPSVEIATWDQALKDLASHIKRADLALANLESPLTDSRLDLDIESDELRYNLCAPSESQQALRTVGMDVLTLANNHIFDCEIRENSIHPRADHGLDETSRILEENKMTPVPGYHIVWKYINTLPLAFIAFDDISSPLDVNAAVEIIRHARRAGGTVIVSIHWGKEYSSKPSARQEKLAEAMAHAGALIIWGHHPHVLQNVTWIQGDGQPFRTLVAYSLGNALFDQVVPMDANRSALLKVTINTYGVRSVDAIPLIIDSNSGMVYRADDKVGSFVFDRLGLDELFASP